MNRLLKDFMLQCLLHCEVPLSWGIADIQVRDGSIQFLVKGCKTYGRVIIIAQITSISVEIKGIGQQTFDNVINAINWIDMNIES